MPISLTTLLATLSSIFCSRASLLLENLALRHQIGLRVSEKTPKLTSRERLLWICLSRLWTGWHSALAIVKPETEPNLGAIFRTRGLLGAPPRTTILERASRRSCHLSSLGEPRRSEVPLHTLGVLHIQYNLSESGRGAEALESLQESQQRLAVAAGGRVALSLASLLLRETLRTQSIRDRLTGLYNRRFMEHALDRELQRAKRKNHSHVVVFLDLDHFKRFNDTHGHEAGDTVLRSMAGLFEKHFRGDDVVCRYGGEESAFILPESSAKDAARRVEDLRQAAKSHAITYKEK